LKNEQCTNCPHSAFCLSLTDANRATQLMLVSDDTPFPESCPYTNIVKTLKSIVDDTSALIRKELTEVESQTRSLFPAKRVDPDEEDFGE